MDAKLYKHLNGVEHPSKLKQCKDSNSNSKQSKNSKLKSKQAFKQKEYDEERNERLDLDNFDEKNDIGSKNHIDDDNMNKKNDHVDDMEIHNTENTDTDQNSPTKYCWVCNTDVYEHSMHCKFCNKCVSRFDHHCMWLNTCVGEANYKSFFRTVQHTFGYIFIHALSTLLVIIFYFTKTANVAQRMDHHPWFGSAVHPTPSIVFDCIFLLVSISSSFLILQLLLFHIVLKKQNLTTYQFIVKANQEERERMRLDQERRNRRKISIAEAKRLHQHRLICLLHLNAIGCCKPCDPILQQDNNSSNDNNNNHNRTDSNHNNHTNNNNKNSNNSNNNTAPNQHNEGKNMSNSSNSGIDSIANTSTSSNSGKTRRAYVSNGGEGLATTTTQAEGSNTNKDSTHGIFLPLYADHDEDNKNDTDNAKPPIMLKINDDNHNTHQYTEQHPAITVELVTNYESSSSLDTIPTCNTSFDKIVYESQEQPQDREEVHEQPQEKMEEEQQEETKGLNSSVTQEQEQTTKINQPLEMKSQPTKDIPLDLNSSTKEDLTLEQDTNDKSSQEDQMNEISNLNSKSEVTHKSSTKDNKIYDDDNSSSCETTTMQKSPSQSKKLLKKSYDPDSTVHFSTLIAHWKEKEEKGLSSPTLVQDVLSIQMSGQDDDLETEQKEQSKVIVTDTFSQASDENLYNLEKEPVTSKSNHQSKGIQPNSTRNNHNIDASLGTNFVEEGTDGEDTKGKRKSLTEEIEQVSNKPSSICTSFDSSFIARDTLTKDSGSLTQCCTDSEAESEYCSRGEDSMEEINKCNEESQNDVLIVV
eukprot:CAMPEP_0184859430 /NCGR_PEP_ID=MMETSP0580-20130426/4433_1 /TAXON_ID=1118495 /ORGANISM="Dactyliosolen fragilissimus" /LENGTH=808 /DNA_ID=CAMNT_0027356059 /DNA_START=716 /DNA_END=3142 /DNA_ORIENTATION=+